MNATVPSSGFYLDRLLEPLAPFLGRPDITDIFINRPGEAWIEALAGPIERVAIPELGDRELQRLARLVAAQTHQAVSSAHPLLAATLPDGSRIQVVLPPATRGGISVSIRRHVVSDLRVADYEQAGAFPDSAMGQDGSDGATTLVDLRERGQFGELLTLAVRQCRNILVSGGTSSGKTTFLNALLQEIPCDERLVLIEDTPELRLRHDNAVGLIAVRGDQGEARVSADDLLTASLRMRPDRIILGELRGPEAFTFIRAVNTGHPGSMSTIHADSPDRAVEQLAMLVLQRGVELRRADIHDYVRSVVDVFVQLERGPKGRRVSEVRLGQHVVEAAAAAAARGAAA